MAEVTFKNKPVTLSGEEVKPGMKAPDFTVLANDLSEVKLSDSKGSVRIISVIPSIDTGVCDQQTRRFNEEASKDGIQVLTISADLPFAQRRWCAASGLDNVQLLSDHRLLSFGEAYGAVMTELRLLARSVFVVDSGDTVVHAEYVKEGSQHPDYEAALQAAREAE